MVFDTLHHELNRESDAPDWRVLLDEAAATWKPEDGAQKIHYAQQAPGRRPGSHTDTIELAPFLTFYRSLAEHRADSAFAMPDIMLEVKDKNLSAIKCILCTSEHGRFGQLEREWARYKYAVLEHDQAAYLALRALLKDKRTWPTVPFYEIVERALAAPVEPGSFRNAAQHVWGYVAPPRHRARARGVRAPSGARRSPRREAQAARPRREVRPALFARVLLLRAVAFLRPARARMFHMKHRTTPFVVP